MTVNALEQYRLAVDQHLVLDHLDLAEADVYRHGLVVALHGCGKVIEVGGLGAPLFHIGHLELGTAALAGAAGSHLVALGILQAQGYGSRSRQSQVYVQNAVLVFILQIGSDTHVGDALLVAGVKIGITRHATETEEVLVLQVGAVTPPEYLERYQVLLARHQIAGHVEFGGELTVLAVAYILAVDPQIYIGRNRTEVRDDVLTLPVGGHLDLAAVCADMVVGHRHVRRIVLKLVAPGVSGVDIQRIAVSVQLPDAGNGHLAPSLVVEVFLPEIHRTPVGVVDPVEFPQTVKAQIVFRSLHVAAAKCRLVLVIGEIRSAHRSAVHRIHLRILPFLECLRRHTHRGRGGKHSRQ